MRFLLVFLVLATIGAWAGPFDDAEGLLLYRINQVRASYQLPPLVPDARLASAARDHSREMAALGYFEHDSPTQGFRTVRDRLRHCGVQALTSGENLATYDGESLQQAADDAVHDWMDSPGHRANLLDPRFHLVGVGVAVQGGTVLVTAVFVQPQARVSGRSGGSP